MSTDKIDDGGPVFPRGEWTGMTLRDYFAGTALIGVLAGDVNKTQKGVIAKAAFDMADAMLSARRDAVGPSHPIERKQP